MRSPDISRGGLGPTPVDFDANSEWGGEYVSELASTQSLYDQPIFNCPQMALATLDADYPKYHEDASFLLMKMLININRLSSHICRLCQPSVNIFYLGKVI